MAPQRARTLFTLILGLLISAFSLPSPSSAQAGPAEGTYDRIFADISARTGKQVYRTGLNGNWQWEEIAVGDSNLGCPNAISGVANSAPGQRRAYKIIVTVNDVGTYDYRVSIDNTVIFLCEGTGLGITAPAATATPIAPAAPPVGGGLPVGLPPQPAPQTAPTTYTMPVLAYIGLDGNVYVTSVGANVAPTALTNDSARVLTSVYQEQGGFKRPVWSPDGSRLMFYRDDKVYTVQSGGAATQVASGINFLIEPAWSSDGTEIAYTVDTRTTSPSDPMQGVYQVQAVPGAGGQPRVVGSIAFGLGCGGGGFGPATALLFDEVGYGGQNFPLLWTQSGFIHPSNCTGIGITLTAPDGRVVWEQKDLGRYALSPDGTKLAAVRISTGGPTLTTIGIFIVDIATGASTQIAIPTMTDYVAWSGDGGSLLYTVKTPRAVVSGNPALTTSVLIAWPVTAQINAVELWSIPAGGGTPTQLFVNNTGSLDSLAAISASPTMALAVFSIVDSDAALINAINSGVPDSALRGVAPRTQIGVASLVANTPGYPFTLPGNGGQPALSRAASFAAVPAPAKPGSAGPIVAGGDNPLGLVIGGRAVVPQGDNVNLRSAPTTQGSTILGLVRPGDTVTILAGPVVADGLRWWQVRRDADGLVAWMSDVDRNGVANMAPMR